MDCYIYIPSHSRAVNDHSFTFPFPSLSLVPVRFGFPFPNTHIKTIQCKCKQSTVEQQKIDPQNTRHRSWKNKKNAKNIFHNAGKSDKIFLHSSCYVSYGDSKIRGHFSRGSFPVPSVFIPTLSYSHPQVGVLFPFPWYSHWIPVPIGNQIPTVISTWQSMRRLFLWLCNSRWLSHRSCCCSLAHIR